MLADVQQVKEERVPEFEGKQGRELPQRRGNKIPDEESAWAKVEGRLCRFSWLEHRFYQRETEYSSEVSWKPKAARATVSFLNKTLKNHCKSFTLVVTFYWLKCGKNGRRLTRYNHTALVFQGWLCLEWWGQNQTGKERPERLVMVEIQGSVPGTKYTLTK